MMKNVCKFCALSFFLFSMTAFVAPVSAHDGEFSLEFDNVGSGAVLEVIHNEPATTDPCDHKGWAIFTLKNTSTTKSWGDLHFTISGVDVTNVSWVVDAPFAPTYVVGGVSRAIDSVVVNNTVQNATLDLFFYNNPLAPGATATFSAYTDNTTDMEEWFGMCVYPTPVPEPATLAMLSLGGLMFFRRRRA